MAFGRHDLHPAELSRMVAAASIGRPFLAYRDVDTVLRIIQLDGDRFCMGRGARNDLVLAWDLQVSRVHALLESLAGIWTLVDDDLSRNGTFVNGTRVRGRRRLSDGDVVTVGATEILYRDPVAEAGATPLVSIQSHVTATTPAQRRVLVALCRPLLDAVGPGATPPSNSELAQVLGVSTEAVRSHLKTLFKLFEVPDLPQNRKRAELARRALVSGVVVRDDLSGERP